MQGRSGKFIDIYNQKIDPPLTLRRYVLWNDLESHPQVESASKGDIAKEIFIMFLIDL